MDQATFWKIIGDARSGAEEDEVFLERVATRLQTLKADELVDFQRHFNTVHAEAYSWKLWGAAYLVNGGCSDDGFDYFRAWLISQGQGPFEHALENPETLTSLATPDVELEEFKYSAGKAYEEKTGKRMPDSVFKGIVRPELGEGWDFDDRKEMEKRYPELFAKFSGG